MADEKKEPWLNWLAMTTVLFAVLATLSTFKGGSYSTKSLLYQSQASDQWAYFQSKSIKSYIYEAQKDRYESELKYSEPKLSDVQQKHYNEKITAFGEKLKKYESEKKTIAAEAKKLEQQRDEAKNHSQAFGMAVIFLQIAILIGSISALMKKKTLWYISIAIGVAGVFNFINGFMLFLSV
ncbi:MAG: DUF4337 domain-containing protein [Nitrospirae bacterium]|nr:DUF4337 domain-containing protein [Nitrospirota bacterium]